MSKQARVIYTDGRNFVETDYALLGLGLNVPDRRPPALNSIADALGVLTFDDIRKIVESSEFAFGRQLFDSSWITFQNGYGSCAGYGGASSFGKARYMQGHPRIDFSGDYLYSLVNRGRDMGSGLENNMRALLDKGVCTAATVPLGGIYPSKYDKQTADAEAARYRGHELYAVPDEQSMATALAMRLPVVMAIHVTNRWRQFDGDDVLAPCNGVGNHCEHLDDIKWDAKRGCFLYRKATSHGKDYSDDGYCWTLWEDHYKQTSRNHMFYAVSASIDDKQGDNPPVIDGAQPEPQPVNKVSIEMGSRSNCGWCSKWKSEVKPVLERLGWSVSEVTESGSVPFFRLTVGTETKSFAGFQTAERLRKEAEEMAR